MLYQCYLMTRIGGGPHEMICEICSDHDGHRFVSRMQWSRKYCVTCARPATCGASSQFMGCGSTPTPLLDSAMPISKACVQPCHDYYHTKHSASGYDLAKPNSHRKYIFCHRSLCLLSPWQSRWCRLCNTCCLPSWSKSWLPHCPRSRCRKMARGGIFDFQPVIHQRFLGG
eukprot:SAG31_NODE_1942_length_6858_cov_7.808404_2_plen_171_part_00